MTGQRRTLQEWRTTETPADVLAAAKDFFARNLGIYAAFIEQESPTHVSLRGQGGEEVIVAAHERDGATLVTGSSYIFDAQLSRFLSTLPPAPATVPALVAAEAAP
jgi:hypothetical protein